MDEDVVIGYAGRHLNQQDVLWYVWTSQMVEVRGCRPSDRPSMREVEAQSRLERTLERANRLFTAMRSEAPAGAHPPEKYRILQSRRAATPAAPVMLPEQSRLSPRPDVETASTGSTLRRQAPAHSIPPNTAPALGWSAEAGS